MNRKDYIEGMMEPFESTVINEKGETIKVFREVDPLMITVHREIIKETVSKVLKMER